MLDKVTVITLTRDRLKLLNRAIASVRSQDYRGWIDHFVLIDDCIETARRLPRVEFPPHRRLFPHFTSRDGEGDPNCAGICHVYPRIARLLNMGVRLANSKWIAFLDDDNEYESNHISSLIECALRHDCLAVHSFRKIYHADGLPYLEPRFPWTHDPHESVRVYDLLCLRGAWVRGSNILKDRAGPFGFAPFRNSTVLSSRDPVFMVDTSVWLLARDLLLEHPIPESYSAEDLNENTAPDDKLLEVLLRHGVRIIATGLPTLRYYLGGVSNVAIV